MARGKAGAKAKARGPIRVSAASDMRADGRHITIVTTAAIPWLTGTSINPLLRASYLAQREGSRRVTLVLPWLEPDDQAAIFPPDLRFTHPAEQEAYIWWWARERRALPCLDFAIAWYPAAYSALAGSIMPTTDVVKQLPAECNDIVILEEPEHLTWNHHGVRWNRHFKHVVGIAHTNYLAYLRPYGPRATAASYWLNSLSVAAYCDVVIKLSDTLQWLPGKCLVANVHGVRPDFLALGDRRAALDQTEPAMRKGAYFLGKALWAKGYRELIEFAASPPGRALADGGMRVACYGSGADSAAIREEAQARGVPLDFHAAIDHAHESLLGLHVFVNASTSEVLCTATAEAVLQAITSNFTPRSTSLPAACRA
jgi:digalactosyldiacylglycerol synthase